MKHGAKKNLLNELKLLPYFDKQRVFHLGKNKQNYNLKDSTLNTYISRFLKDREIIPLKRELYIPTDFYNTNKVNISYLYYLANILRRPSYVTSWTALQYYDLTTDVIKVITSATLKTTRSHKTKAGSFIYQSIQRELFSGFRLVKGKFDYFIATPSKALFDLLYFRTRQFRGLSLKDVKLIVEDLRIDLDEMSKEERDNFFSMVKEHIYHE